MAWVEDRVPIYDLAQKDLEKWLKDKFGNWKFKVHKTNDEFVFLAPRKLTAVMPAFLDFIFPFGRQQYPQDFHFGAFNHEECITEHDRGPQIPELKRSGYGFQMCYNLRSVEPSKNHEEWPWSIRQTAIYHSFDLDTLRATWIIIKGNQLMKKRITATTGVDDPSTLATLDTVGPVAALERTLATQLILCDWSGENWRWFINFLEEALQNATRHTLSVTVDKPPKKSPNAIKEKKALRTTRRTFSHFNRIFSSPISEKSQCETPDVLISPASTFPPWTPDSRNYPAEEEEKHEPDEVELPTFSFRDLQRIQFIEEKTNETLLVLKVNLNVLAELKEHYSSIGSQIYTYNEDCSGIVARFIKRISSIEKDVRMQLSRVKTLLRLLADRKNLLYGILQYQSMEASKLLAEKSQHSTDNMEDMTKGMHKIAQKTQQETVSMRIITLVTLFFLPGTFISTLMSTDIFKFETGNSGKTQKFVQTGALQLFMSITIPLMVLTFGAWYGVYWWVNHREKKKGRVNSAFISRV
ncbi:hypothetical protein K432DRAFT_341488 [Lepidopterella palustris CBS 459.81]|uniref:CorA-like transporter domain-containing protein n=1 Tax=Lepidopterella palustris CBS 459.81 TaxID=1314670 RepID=A0A8E2ELW2_9PEZI|nr:hypothetical protein K432DRAFT_341488 [Lepidopterella palustris CBS 459.81]